MIKTVPVGSAPFGVAFNPSNNDIYVANFGSTTVFVIDSSTNEVVNTISVGRSPISIAFNPSNNDMYVTNQGPNTVSVVDISTNEVIDTIPVGAFPQGYCRCYYSCPSSKSTCISLHCKRPAQILYMLICY